MAGRDRPTDASSTNSLKISNVKLLEKVQIEFTKVARDDLEVVRTVTAAVSTRRRFHRCRRLSL